jgi:hypothetical protein
MALLVLGSFVGTIVLKFIPKFALKIDKKKVGAISSTTITIESVCRRGTTEQ